MLNNKLFYNHFVSPQIKPAIFFAVLLLTILPNGILYAQFNPDHIEFHRLSHEAGLNQSPTDAIFQDSEGYMWFGTHDGLYKYNGYEVEVYTYDPDDPNSINYNEIRTIFEDANNNLWFGTRGRGLALYNRDKDHFITYKVNQENPPAGPSENTIYGIVQHKEGYLWIATENGLNRFDVKNETFQHFFAEPDNSEGLIDNTISALHLDSRQNLWIGSRYGITIKDLESGTFRQIKHDPDDPQSIGSNAIEHIYESRDSTIWIGTRGGGLNYYDRKTDRFHKYLHNRHDSTSISGNTVYSILEDSNGLLWVGTMNKGLNAFDREEEKFYRFRHDPSKNNSISYSTVYSLFETANGILWVGTIGGLNLVDLKPPMFEHYKHNPENEQSLSHDIVQSFREDRSGNLWVGTDGGGLNLFDREANVFIKYRHDPDNPETIPDDVILDIREDEDGYLWLATYNNGISRFDIKNHRFKHYPPMPDEPGRLNIPHTFRLLFDDNQLWIGTHQGGINVLDLETDKFTSYMLDENDPGSLPNDYIQSIYKDSNNVIWVGTHGTGLARFNRENETFQGYTEQTGTLSGRVIFSIQEDNSGRFWVGTKTGLALFDREQETFTVFTEKDGLANDVINGILEDENGNLWLSTNSGISKFYPDTHTFENYGVESGLPGEQYNPRAFYKDSEGYMYFGSKGGFTRFHPGNVSLREQVAPVVITDFMIFNQPVAIDSEDSPLDQHISQTETLTLSHDESVLTFEYASQDFDINKENEFAYKLDGFDNDWNYVGSKRSATYTNLNPGEYTLRIKSANSSGIWGEQEATLGIIITPPFWKTSWFYFISVFFVIGLIGGGYRYRLRSVSERNKLLEKEVNRQTSELSDKNSKLTKALQDLKQTRSELVEKAHKAGMADLATNVLHNIGNILNSVNISATMIGETIKYSRLSKLKQANVLLREHEDNLRDFILNDPKGEKLLAYYLKLEEPVDREYSELKKHNKRLKENIKLIIDVVNTQQSFANAGRVLEWLSLEQLIEDTLVLQSSTIERHELTIIKEYGETEEVNIEKSKMIHTLVNLLKNAKESMEGLEADQKKLTIKTFQDDEYTCVSITDTGVGIKKENMEKMFKHGFTTKKSGHGFGLHSCANYMKELDGTINIKSEGENLGATVTLGFSRKEKSIHKTGSLH